jgi:hypothetical protein
MLLELTAAETAFLTTPVVVSDAFPQRLTRRLAATLTARLQVPVRALPLPGVAPPAAPTIPTWQPDATLATLWLTRRLGGRRVSGTSPFVPTALMRTLDAVLAESWLDEPAPEPLPSALAWQLGTDLAQATLSLTLPPQPADLTRWARGVIRHG